MKDFFAGKKVGLPGGGGFLGGFLKTRLNELGAEVAIPLRSEGWDLRKPEHVQRFYEQESFDLVINCAAYQGGIAFHSGKQSDMYHDNLLMGTFLLEGAYKAGVPKFVNLVPGCSYPGYLEK